MIYKANTQRLLDNLKWLVLLTLVAILGLIVFSHNNRMILGILLIFSLLAIPQIFLVFQYERATKFDRFEIDEKNGNINVLINGSIIQKEIGDLKNIQHHHAVVSFRSLMLKMCEHFSYYKFEFKDNTTYYLTSLVSPAPSFSEKGIFYPFLINVERTYASIK